MLTNYERVMKRFIPAFRVKAAQMMVRQYKIKQQRAAMMLGTTQAAISKYLKADSGRFGDVEIDNAMLREFIESANKNEKRDAQSVMCKMCQSNKKFDCGFMVR